MEPQITISGFGMVTSLGRDAASSCATARAGISRGHELGIMKIRREEDGEMEEVVGHSVPGLTDGFEGDGRLIALGWNALRDLLKPEIKKTIDWNRAACFITFPNFDRTRLGLALIQNEGLRKAREGEQTEPPDPRAHLVRAQMLMERILKLADVPLPPERCFVNFGEHAAFSGSAQAAMGALVNRQIDLAVVGAVDSLIDSKVLLWLYQTGRLKCSDVSAGLQPAEGSGFLLFERDGPEKSKGRSPIALITRIVESVESQPLLQGEPATGRALSQALSELASASSVPAEKVYIVSDHNGEPYRAYDWGLAQNRLASKFPWIGEIPTSYPITSFGDTGAAYGVVASCTVLRAWQRGYARFSTAWIAAASAEGPCTAMVVKQISS